jgi:hypothetical protein
LSSSARARKGLLGAALVACAAAGVVAAFMVRPPLAFAQTVSLPTTVPTTTAATTTEPKPDPGPQPKPSPAPSATPTPSSSSTTDEPTKHVTHSVRHKPRHHHHVKKPVHHAPRPVPFAHDPRDVSVYGSSEPTLAITPVAAQGARSLDFKRLSPFLFAVLALSLALLAVAAVPPRTLAGLSGHLLTHRTEVAIAGVSIMSGVLAAFVVIFWGA